MDISLSGTIIDNIVRENKIYRMSCELEHIDNKERKESLREVLSMLRNKDVDKSERARENINNVCNKLTESKFKKGWNRLLTEQKEEQLNRFFKDEKNDDIKKKVLKLFNDGKLKQKMVEYDKTNGKIISFNLGKQSGKKEIDVEYTSSSEDE